MTRLSATPLWVNPTPAPNPVRQEGMVSSAPFHQLPVCCDSAWLTLSTRVQAGYLKRSIFCKEQSFLQRVPVQPGAKHHPLRCHLAPPGQPPCQAVPHLHHAVQRVGVHCFFSDCLAQLLTATSVARDGREEGRWMEVGKAGLKGTYISLDGMSEETVR